ncbi:hypothetical protein Agub_g3601 [Astrephomene gubernaculifera]|uniref:Uncharacterized protein n=1 Tax=Astrephomene gubernaculifera TaxID=47775 RepID=A0AAD3HIL0_9CHLO|nr:hypothetical protein Agub_g3601 [Astrephomene gubernaculifera]
MSPAASGHSLGTCPANPSCKRLGSCSPGFRSSSASTHRLAPRPLNRPKHHSTIPLPHRLLATSMSSSASDPPALTQAAQPEGHLESSAAAATQRVAGLSQLAGRYKALLLDQFGVLHDGRRPYPGAIAAVRAACAAGLRLLVLSNSSRRSGGTLDKLAELGFPRECFEGGRCSHQRGAHPPLPHPPPRPLVGGAGAACTAHQLGRQGTRQPGGVRAAGGDRPTGR